MSPLIPLEEWICYLNFLYWILHKFIHYLINAEYAKRLKFVQIQMILCSIDCRMVCFFCKLERVFSQSWHEQKSKIRSWLKIKLTIYIIWINMIFEKKPTIFTREQVKPFVTCMHTYQSSTSKCNWIILFFGSAFIASLPLNYSSLNDSVTCNRLIHFTKFTWYFVYVHRWIEACLVYYLEDVMNAVIAHHVEQHCPFCMSFVVCPI